MNIISEIADEKGAKTTKYKIFHTHISHFLLQ